MQEFDAEVFAVGKWNGMEFTESDLAGIVETFAALGDNMRVPLKMGHNNEQQMTDGHPALGWVSKLWVEGNKLMARFSDLPEVVMSAIRKKLYRNVSIELDVDVEHKGNSYPYVLTGVALLGADIPAVNTLKDLTHYMGRARMAFTAIAGNIKGDQNMELEEATKKVAEMTVKVAELTAANASLSAEVLKFTNAEKARAEAEAAAIVKVKRTEAEGLLEAGVKSGAITPAQRTQYSKLLKLDDDAAVKALDMGELKELVGAKQFSKEQAKNGESGSDLPAGQRVVNEINAVLAKGEAKTFAQAQALVFGRDPQLAREWVDSNKED